MTDMSDKFSCIIKNKDGITIDAINVVGATFNEVAEMAKKMEDKTGNTYIIIKDEYIFQAIYVLESKYINAISKLVDVRDDINDIISNKD